MKAILTGVLFGSWFVLGLGYVAGATPTLFTWLWVGFCTFLWVFGRVMDWWDDPLNAYPSEDEES